jgi:hypothetical protein
MSKIIDEALTEYKAVVKEATKVAKNNLSKEMSDKFDKFLKEEIKNKLVKESMIEQQEDSMVSDGKEDSMAVKSDDVQMSESDAVVEENINESDDEDINLDDLKEAMEELNIDDEEQIVDEHDMSLHIDFDKDGIQITDVTADDKEFDDINLELDDFEGEESEEEIDLDMEDDLSSVEGDELDLDFSDEEGSEEESEEEEIDLDMEDDDTLSEDDFDIEGLDMDGLDDFEEEEEVEEGLAHTMTHQNARQVGSEGNVNYEKEKRLRFAVREAKVLKAKVAKMMSENKQLTDVNKGFKTSIEKYKDQLFEMVFHNANLSHVNNLFVEHTTTTDEKTDIISKFSNVQSIDESKKLYKVMKQTLTEGKKTKKTIEESISRSSTTDEAIITETVTYADNGVNAIKDMINRMEGRK